MKRFAPLISAALFLSASIAGAAPATNAGPDATQLQRSLLANEFALVPRLSLLVFHRNLQSGFR